MRSGNPFEYEEVAEPDYSRRRKVQGDAVVRYCVCLAVLVAAIWFGIQGVNLLFGAHPERGLICLAVAAYFCGVAYGVHRGKCWAMCSAAAVLVLKAVELSFSQELVGAFIFGSLSVGALWLLRRHLSRTDPAL